MNKPHPIDFKHYKPMLLQVVQETDTSMPDIVRAAVKEYLKKYYRKKLKSMRFFEKD